MKNKIEQEKEFVSHIKGRIKSWSEMYDRGNWYQVFWLTDGSQRFWTNMSKASFEELGIHKDGEAG